MNEKGLGKYQRDMLGFARRLMGIHYMTMDSFTKRVAASLEQRGLISIGRECGQWYFQGKEKIC